jgi:hypothetical protein
MDYRGIDIRVIHEDVFTRAADLLVLKYAQESYGVDEKAIEVTGIDRAELPVAGDDLLIERPVPLPYRQLLFLGVEPLYAFNYRSVREFSRRALARAMRITPPVRELTMTLHGAGFGLDETEAFESEVAGIVEAIDSRRYPRSLQTVSIVERGVNRAARLQRALESLLGPGLANPPAPAPAGEVIDFPGRARGEETLRRVDAVGYNSAARPHAFVAMPFGESFEDVFYYGIQPPVQSAGLLCERMDLISFTGDIVEHMREKISSASILVADLSEANPNVYLEIGYAWGVRTPCILVCNRKSDLKFDLRGQRCLHYGSIKELEISLSAELRALAARASWRMES